MKPSTSANSRRHEILVLRRRLQRGAARGCRDEDKDPVKSHAGHVGAVNFPVSCSPAAQREFNEAVALLHHMTYPQAREAFQQVAATDPALRDGAMGHRDDAVPAALADAAATRRRCSAGWDAVQKAKALQPPTERERLFVAAAEAFFLEPASPDYWLRIRRWEQATAKVYAAFPDDPEAAAFYALALLATAPSDTISREHADRAAEILLARVRAEPGSSRRDALSRPRQRCAGPRTGVAGDHAQVRGGRAAQSARAPHADAHLHAPRRLGRGDPGQPAGGGRGAGVSRRRARRVRLGRVPPRDRVPRLRLSAEGRGRQRRRAAAAAARRRARLEPTFKTPSIWHPRRPAMRWSGAPGTRRPRIVPRQPPASTGIDSPGRRPSRSSRAGWARLIWASSPKPGRRRASGGARSGDPEGGRGAVCPEHPDAAPGIRVLAGPAAEGGRRRPRADANGGSNSRPRRRSMR